MRHELEHDLSEQREPTYNERIEYDDLGHEIEHDPTDADDTHDYKFDLIDNFNVENNLDIDTSEENDIPHTSLMA